MTPTDTSHYGELRQGWAVCQLSDVIELYSGQDLTPDRYNDCKLGIPYITGASCLEKGRVLVNRWTETPQTHSCFGDLLLTCKGAGVGKMAISHLEDAHIARQIMAIRPYCDVSIKYLQYTLSASVGDLIEQANGLIPGIRREIVLDFSLSLPPLAEQHRIVAAIESVFAVIDKIDQSKGDLAAGVTAAKSKILSLAVTGKLVPQDDSDEPASVLFDRICAERTNLIKAGKIKPGKREKEVSETRDNSHYGKLPVGWEFAPIGSLFDIVGGGTPSTLQSEYWDDGKPWFSSADIDDSGKITPRRSVTQLGIENSTTNVVEKDSVIVVTRIGLGKVAVLDRDMCFSQDSQALISFSKETLYSRYVYYVLFHEMQSLKHSGRGTTISGITKKQLTDAMFPLPPLAEQRRIADSIDVLYRILEEIMSNIK
ncbi:MAG: restriction endonuclease subunit S [Deltaproteobacteria bacterium]|nr:restriction endonuclease subunit S [Deltaproteobacteria bacterium]